MRHCTFRSGSADRRAHPGGLDGRRPRGAGFRRVQPRSRPGAGRTPAFTKSHREGVVVSDNGRVRLGHALSPLGAISVDRVWDLARTREGILLAATGDAGKVLGREPKPGAAWNVVYDSGDSQVLSLVVTPGGISYAGTGPTGQVVNLTDPKHPVSRPDPKVQYIWDLACDGQGNLLAATGPSGQLWNVATDGRWSLFRQQGPHCVPGDRPDGSIYAGSDGEGLIYRVLHDGKATIIFDAPQSEIRTLLWGGDGTFTPAPPRKPAAATRAGAQCSCARRGAPASRRPPFGRRRRNALRSKRRRREGSDHAGPGRRCVGRPGPPRAGPEGSASPKPVAAAQCRLSALRRRSSP